MMGLREEAFDLCKTRIVERFRNDIEALILVGSFARGEEIVRHVGGKEVFVSDMEFLAVTKKDGMRKELQIDIEGVDVSIGKTTLEHLKRLQPRVFTLELKKFGQVIWGYKRVLDYIPEMTEKDIDPLDGLILLNNRMVEQMKLRLRMEKEDVIDPYDMNKGYMQLANSLLTVHGRYECLYADKVEALNKLPIDTALKGRIQEAFVNGRSEKTEPYTREKAFELWEQLREDFKWVRNYERERVRETLPLRLKGWARLVVYKKTRFFTPGEFLNNFYRRSPQFLVYAQAAKVYFADSWQPERAKDIIDKWEQIVR